MSTSGFVFTVTAVSSSALSAALLHAVATALNVCVPVAQQVTFQSREWTPARGSPQKSM